MNIIFSARGDEGISNCLDFIQKRRQTGQPVTCQTCEMEVSFLKPYPGFCAAHAIIF